MTTHHNEHMLCALMPMVPACLSAFGAMVVAPGDMSVVTTVLFYGTFALFGYAVGYIAVRIVMRN